MLPLAHRVLRSVLWSAPLAAICAGAALAQSTIVVTGGGANLQQAIDRASPGDTLDVRAGTYNSVVVDKGLRILCSAGVTVVRTALAPSVIIDGVPAGQLCDWYGGACNTDLVFIPALRVARCDGTVVLRGPLWPVGTGGASRTFEVAGCRGPVLFDGITFGVPGAPRSAHIRDSAQVTLNTCTLRDALYVERSAVALSDSELVKGLRIDGGSVVVADTDIEGVWQWSGMGYPGVTLDSGELTLTGTMEVIARSASQVAAIETHGGLVRIGPDVTLRASFSPPITGPATVLQQHVPSAHVASAASGQTLDLRITGEPGVLTATFLDLTPAPLSTPFGTLWVAPTSPVIDLRPLDATGEFRLTTPANVPAGTTATFQPLSLSAQGALWIGTPARVHIH